MFGFLDEKVDGPCFLKLTEDNLKYFGLPLGIIMKVQDLQEEVYNTIICTAKYTVTPLKETLEIWS